MFRVNSTSKQLVRLNVVTAGVTQQVDLLPKNFVFTDSVTPQMKLLEKEGVIRVRETKVTKVSAEIKPQEKSEVPQTDIKQSEAEGKLDFVSDDDKVAKVQKKKK